MFTGTAVPTVYRFKWDRLEISFFPLTGEIHMLQQQSERQMEHADSYKSKEYKIKKTK